MNPIRVLNVLPEKNCKEAEVFVMNIYRNINKDKIQFDFLFQGNEKSVFEDEIISLGGNIFAIDKLKTVGVYNYRESIKEFFEYHRGYDIVHCYLDRYSGIVLSEARKSGIKIRVAHMYNNDIKLNKIGYLKFCINKNANYKFAYSRNDGESIFGESKEFALLKNVIGLDKFSHNEKEENVDKNILDRTLVRGNLNQEYIKDKIRKLGYDLREEAKTLENFYLRAYKNKDNKEFS